jgi:FdhD protein
VKPKIEIPALKVNGPSVEGVIDEVASELPVRLVLNGEPLVTLLCTPTELPELAVGFLLSEGMVRGRSSIGNIQVSDAERLISVTIPSLAPDWKKLFETRTISSGCGKGVTFTHYDRTRDRRITAKGPVLALDSVRQQLRQFRDLSALYLETGGVHSAALSDGTRLLFFSEDIGRHNAVDKLIGKAFLQGITTEDKVLLTSGRVTSEIVTKVGRNGIPVLISRAAPSCMAVSYAEDMGITLIGFARGERMNIYSWPGRIKF